jgi:hypothetical protein
VGGLNEEEADDAMERLMRLGVVEESWATQNEWSKSRFGV